MKKLNERIGFYFPSSIDILFFNHIHIIIYIT